MRGWEVHTIKSLRLEFPHLDDDDVSDLIRIKEQKKTAFEIVEKLPNLLTDRQQRQICKVLLSKGVLEYVDEQDKKALSILRIQE